MLYQLTFAVCSILHGGCHAENITVEPDLSPIPYMQMKNIEFELAKWKREHGDEWSIVKWALHPVSRIAKS